MTFTRESLAIEVGQRLNGDDVARVLDRIRCSRGALPKKIRVGNGTEFTSKRLDQWAYLSGVRLDFSRPGKPTDNGLIEVFNGRLRAECLNENWLLVAGRCEGESRSLEIALQYRATTQRLGKPGRIMPKTHPPGGTGTGTNAVDGRSTAD